MRTKNNSSNNRWLLICLIIGIIGLITTLLSSHSENSIHQYGSVQSSSSSFMFVQGKFFNKIKSAVSKAKSSVSSGVSKAKSTVKKTASQLRGAVSSNIRKGANSVKAIVKKTGNSVAKKIGKTIATTKKVVKHVKAAKGTVKKVINQTKGNVKKTLKNVRGNVKKTAKKVGGQLKKTGKKVGGHLKKTGKKVGGHLKKAGKKIGNKLKKTGKKVGGHLKKAGKKIGNKLKKAGKKIKSQVSKARTKLRAAGAKVDKLLKKAKKPLADIRKKLKSNTIKKLEKLKKDIGKIKSAKGWKLVSGAFKQAKKTLKGVKQVIKNAKAKDKSKVIKIGSTNNMNPNTKIVKSITSGDINVASQISENAYGKNSEKKLEKQGYKVASDKEKLASAKVYYNENDKTLVVTFRGTASMSDWKTNMNVDLKGAYFDGKYAGRVHAGYYKEYMKDRAAIQKIIKSYEDKGLIANIVFTGHSKGGAIGEIAATDYQLTKSSKAANVKLITFGSPRSGDDKHADIVNEKVPEYVRVVNTFDKKGKKKQDLVSKVPPKFLGYVHAGTQVEIGCGKKGGVACHKMATYLANTEH